MNWLIPAKLVLVVLHILFMPTSPKHANRLYYSRLSVLLFCDVCLARQQKGKTLKKGISYFPSRHSQCRMWVVNYRRFTLNGRIDIRTKNFSRRSVATADVTPWLLAAYTNRVERERPKMVLAKKQSNGLPRRFRDMFAIRPGAVWRIYSIYVIWNVIGGSVCFEHCFGFVGQTGCARIQYYMCVVGGFICLCLPSVLVASVEVNIYIYIETHRNMVFPSVIRDCPEDNNIYLI